MSGRPGTSQLHRISALRASSAIAAGTPRAKSPPPRFSASHPAHVCGRIPIVGTVHEVLQGTSTGIHQSVNSSTSSAHSTHIKSLTTTTHSSPHLPTYLQVRFPPLYAEVDALLGCWSMVAVCQERPWTPAVHTDRNVQRGARARNERGMAITKHLQHPTCMTRDKLTHTHKNMLISPIPQSRAPDEAILGLQVRYQHRRWATRHR